MLALRNVVRALPRMAPIIGIIASVLAATLIGNAVLATSDEALYATYVQNIAADLAVAAESERSFTIFGSDQLLIGDLTTVPTLIDSGSVRQLLEAEDSIRAIAGVVTAAAIMNADGPPRPVTVLGVDFADYAAVFPSQRPVVGRFPESGQPGIVLQENRTTATIGDRIRLSSRTGQTFTLREVPLTGLIRYPIQDPQIDTLVLVDADTARALNGYVYGAVDEAQVTAETQLLLDTGLDALFDGAAPAPETDNSTDAIDLDALLSGDSAATRERETRARAARQTLPGAWNFMLVSLRDSRRARTAARSIQRNLVANSGNEVRRWWQTIGGTAAIVRMLRVVFNAGLAVVAIGAATVSSNALVLLILERRNELGTMRALGSSKVSIALLVCRETLIVVGISAGLGVLLGILGVSLINAAGLVPQNQYITALFGGGTIGARASGPMIAAHVLGAMVVGVFAAAHPIREAVRVHPREAMTA